jgi:hypothetical protein
MTDAGTARYRRRLVLRIVLITLASVLGAPAAVVAGYAAEIEGSGCFIECNSATDHPNAAAGLLLGLLTVALALAGPLLAWVLLRKTIAVVLAFVPMLVVVALLAGA